MNGDLGDYGSIFFDATTDGCMEDAREYLEDKLLVQNLNPQNWRRWLNGTTVYLMTAAALRLGAAHRLTPDLHQQILQALDDYEHELGPNGTCTSNNGNSCMDNYTVHAAGSAWAAAYLTITGTAATPDGRTAQYFKDEATSYLDKSFSQTESICIHRITEAPPYDACTDCQLISDADDLRDKIVNDELEVLSFEHNSESPNYGAGLLTLVSIAFQGLKKAGEPYAATDLQKVIAHGLARTAQLHASGGSACSASWLTNCPRISCPGGANPCSFDLCTSANLTTGTCITDTCAPQPCKDLDYSPGMYPIHALLTNPSSPLAGQAATEILLPAPRYQFDDFCPCFFSTTGGFFNDGREASYNEIAYVWAFVSQPELGGVTTPPTGWVDGYDQQHIWGWACDPDYPTLSNRVDVYTTSGQYLGSADANHPSSAPINYACRGGSAHYFDFQHNGAIAPGTHFMVWSIELPYGAPAIANRRISGNGSIGDGTEFVMPPSTPVCMDNLNLSNQTITTTQVFEACHTITATNFAIGPGGNVTFHAVDLVALGSGFSVSLGGQLKVVVP